MPQCEDDRDGVLPGRQDGPPFTPVVVRGRVVEWLEGDAAWEIIDQLSAKYTGGPYSRGQERVVAVIEPERQTVGIG